MEAAALAKERAVTRIPWCEWRPGPASKHGYGGTTQLPVSYKEGEVKHSAEGPLSATFGVLDNPNRQASWHFTLPKQGPVRVYQHYELEDICWHCGLPGDERHDTSLVGNLTLWGEEHEGIAGEALTPWQVENTIKLSEELRRQSPTYGRESPSLRVNLWEHNWLSPAPTACPSGRIPWAVIIAALQTPQEEDDMAWTDPQVAEQLTRMANINAQTDKLSLIDSRLANLDARDDQILDALNKILQALTVSGGAHTHPPEQ